MSGCRHFLMVKYTLQGTRFMLPTTVHVPSPSEWFQGNRDALLLELQEELIQHHGRFSVSEEHQQFEFLTTLHMKVICRVEKNRMRHALLMNGNSILPMRSHEYEVVAWLYPLEADIPLDFIRI